MASLSAHLRGPDDHGRLAFHPECPLCRGVRVAGTPGEVAVSRRVQAALVAGVLALSSVTPVAALAAEGDQEREGTAAPDVVTTVAPGSSPDFDPGGDSFDLSSDTAAAPQPPAAPVEGAGDSEEVDSADTGTDAAGPGDDAVAPIADEALAPAPPVPEASVLAPGDSTSAPAPAEPAETPAGSDTAGAARSAAAQREAGREHKPRSHAAVPAPAHRSVAPPPTAPAPASVSSAPSLPAPVPATRSRPAAPSSPAVMSQGRAAHPGERFHVVLGGESLWSIAGDLLGDRASVARVAREVNRLWELNSERIATGDRDLLMVGTRLALR